MVLIYDFHEMKSLYHLNICLKNSIYVTALEDTSASEADAVELPQEAGKHKSSEALDAPLSKRPCTTLHDVPSLRLNRSNTEQATPVIIAPLTRQQMLYLAEGFRVWTWYATCQNYSHTELIGGIQPENILIHMLLQINLLISCGR